MKISMIAAIGKNRELGKNNRLLWHIPEDAKYFRDKTRGHVNIMGRITFESIVRDLGKPLPDRTNVIVSRDKNYQAPEGCFVFQTVEEALDFAKQREKDEIFIIGGAQIYSLGMPYADKLYLTLVDAEFPDADAYFPEYSDFKKVVSKRESSGSGYNYTFLELER